MNTVQNFGLCLGKEHLNIFQSNPTFLNYLFSSISLTENFMYSSFFYLCYRQGLLHPV